jgi:hypothetical protein
MGDALAELVADITEAARTIGTLLQPESVPDQTSAPAKLKTSRVFALSEVPFQP